MSAAKKPAHTPVGPLAHVCNAIAARNDATHFCARNKRHTGLHVCFTCGKQWRRITRKRAGHGD